MTPDLQQEFRALSERAKQQLREVPVSPGMRHVFSFWAFPSFSPALRCTVYCPKREGTNKAFASLNVWRTDLDLEKLKSPIERLKHPTDLEPTMQGDTIWLTGSEVGSIEQRIGAIPVPLYIGDSSLAGTDGTTFEFHYSRNFFGASIHWWVDQPSDWQPFNHAILQIIEEIRQRSTKSCAVVLLRAP